MQISKIGFYGNLSNAKIKNNTLIIGDEKYNKGDKVYIDFNRGQSKEVGIITGFTRTTNDTNNKNINAYNAANHVLTYINLKNGEEKTTLAQVPFGYDIYNEKELKAKISSKLDETEELITAKEQFYDRNLQGRQSPPNYCIVESNGKKLIDTIRRLDIIQ